jgi:N6-L-threonylcarbamoyladenine synthase
VLEQTLAQAGVSPADLDALAVTKGPGLLGSLLVGTTTARALSLLWGKPLIGVHHTLGHLTSTWLDALSAPQFPILTLSASGGHTDLWLRTAHTAGKLVGRTRDDAAGEAFDKGAALLGLPYPGGPAIAALAASGNPFAHAFPLPLKKEEGVNFSFSGLKTALRYLLRDEPPASESERADIAASYEQALCAHLVDRVALFLSEHSEIREVHLVGGVSANTRLRTLTAALCARHGVTLRFPTQMAYCTDNAAMIAAAAEFLAREQPACIDARFETQASLALDQAVR